ncbi:hypothetical protein B0I32_121178 [Nonomuraea fuscirosea]|uniref:Uncharacterized protein n=1 Tax=Nonomuraea fuscirosea TaxID=1291556 RepID=A0A2T0MMK6_9ACTN|nr:hypothetical protein B0I32_121178 [Nonomuraea fuscirosea]
MRDLRPRLFLLLTVRKLICVLVWRHDAPPKPTSTLLELLA